MSARPGTRLWLCAIAGISVWFLYFLAVYALHSIGCARGWNALSVLGVNALTFALGSLTLAALALIALSGWGGYRALAPADGDAARSRRFAAVLTLMLASLATVATMLVGLPVVIAPPCH